MMPSSPLRSFILENRVYTKAQQEEVASAILKKEKKQHSKKKSTTATPSSSSFASSPSQLLDMILNKNDDENDVQQQQQHTSSATAKSQNSPKSNSIEFEAPSVTTIIDDGEDHPLQNNNNNNSSNNNDDDEKTAPAKNEQQQNQDEEKEDQDSKKPKLNPSEFHCYPISATKKSEICFSLLDSEEKVKDCLAKLMPVLKQILFSGGTYHLSFDAEWHQPAGERFESPNTQLSLVQVGIAEAPLHRQSPILVLVFDLLRLDEQVTSDALQEIFHTANGTVLPPDDVDNKNRNNNKNKSNPPLKSIQFAFDCRRDAKILYKYGVTLERIFDLQLLERASRLELVPPNMSQTYVFRLCGLHKIMMQFQHQLDFFCDMKTGINADDSEENFLKRPLSQETLLYSAVDAAILFLLYVEMEAHLGQICVANLTPEIFESSHRYANFELLADDVRFSEHGILPLKIIPRLDGNRAGHEPCGICKRRVAHKAGQSCVVCKRRELDLKRKEKEGLLETPLTPPQSFTNNNNNDFQQQTDRKKKAITTFDIVSDPDYKRTSPIDNNNNNVMNYQSSGGASAGAGAGAGAISWKDKLRTGLPDGTQVTLPPPPPIPKHVLDSLTKETFGSTAAAVSTTSKSSSSSAGFVAPPPPKAHLQPKTVMVPLQQQQQQQHQQLYTHFQTPNASQSTHQPGQLPPHVLAQLQQQKIQIDSPTLAQLYAQQQQQNQLVQQQNQILKQMLVMQHQQQHQHQHERVVVAPMPSGYAPRPPPPPPPPQPQYSNNNNTQQQQLQYQQTAGFASSWGPVTYGGQQQQQQQQYQPQQQQYHQNNFYQPQQQPPHQISYSFNNTSRGGRGGGQYQRGGGHGGQY